MCSSDLYKKRGAAAMRNGQYKKRGAAATRNGQYKMRDAAATRNGQYKKRGRCRNEKWSVKKAGALLQREMGSIKSRGRSEEHTSELQSHSELVCRLLLEKKNNTMS